MDIPYRDVRLIYLRMLIDLLRNGQRTFYPDLRFVDAVGVMVIAATILLAQAEGTPFTIVGLSLHLGIPRATLLRRLGYLDRKKYLLRIGRRRRHLAIDTKMLATPPSERNLRRACQIITAAAAEISVMEVSKMDAI